MTNKYLDKIAMTDDQKGTAKSYARISGLSTVGGIAGGVLGAAALGSKPGARAMGSRLGRRAAVGAKLLQRRFTGSGIGKSYAKLMPNTGAALAGAFIGSHVGGEAGEYAGIKASKKDLQKKSSYENAIVTKLLKMIEGY